MRSTLHFHGEALELFGNFPRVEIVRQGPGILLRGTYDFGDNIRTVTVREDRKVGTITVPASMTKAMGLDQRALFDIAPASKVGQKALFFKLTRLKNAKRAADGAVRCYTKR